MEGGSGLIDNFDEKWFGHQATKPRTTHQSLHKNANGTFTLPAFTKMNVLWIARFIYYQTFTQSFYTKNNDNAQEKSTAINWLVSQEKKIQIILLNMEALH